MRPTRSTAIVGLWVFLLAGVWAISVPPYGSPDEQAHVVRAVGTWSGTPLKGEVTNDETGFRVDVSVPAHFDTDRILPTCWMHQPDATADCHHGPPRDSRIITTRTSAGLHPPFWYAAVGWAGRLVPSQTGFYLMRLVAVTLCALVIAPLGASLRTRHNSAIELPAALAGITPVALFLCGTVNPNGYEVCVAIALWGSGLTAARFAAAGEAVPRYIAVHTSVAATTLALTRPLSPGFALAILATIAIVTRPGVVALARRRSTQLLAAPVAVAVVLAGVWALYSGHLTVEHAAIAPPVESRFEALMGSLAHHYQQMLGTFSWLDAGVSSAAVLAWGALVGVLVGAAVTLGRPRWAVAMAACGVVGHFAPALLQLGSYPVNGIVWQGRYSLPWMVGVPILAAASTAGRLDRAAARRITVAVAPLIAAGHVGGYWLAMRRWTVGHSQRWWFLGDPEWQPPAPFVLWVVVPAFVVIAVAGAAALVALAFAADDDAADPAASPGSPEPPVPTVSPAGSNSATLP